MTSGIIGASLADVITATSLVSGPDRLDPSALPFWPEPVLTAGPWRVAYRASLGSHTADPAVDRLVRESLAVPDIAVHDASLDWLPVDEAWLTLRALDALGADVDGPALADAVKVRSHNSTALADLFSEVDALVTPTTPRVAHGYDRHEEHLMVCDLCWGFNVTGHPAVSVPVGLVDGLPVGAQVVAPHGRDDVALSVAARIMTPLSLPG